MKKSLLLLWFAFVFAAGVFAADSDSPVYVLRTYTATEGKLDAVLARFREHTCQLFEKHGMVNIGYWVPMDAADGAGEKLVYLLQHKSREAAKASWKNFGADPEWQAVRKASEADGKIVAKAESVFLVLTNFSQPLSASAQAPSRVFELRTYTTAEGRLGALDARFAGGETDLFVKSGMRGLAYFHPMDADKGAGHTLIYFMVHPSREASVESWKKFRADPAWVKMKADSEKDGKITTETKSMFLAPVDFSQTK
jgi:hypothetical protein